MSKRWEIRLPTRSASSWLNRLRRLPDTAVLGRLVLVLLLVNVGAAAAVDPVSREGGVPGTAGTAGVSRPPMPPASAGAAAPRSMLAPATVEAAPRVRVVK